MAARNTISPLERLILQQLITLLFGSPSIHGRRTRGARESQAPTDYIIRKELTNAKKSLFGASLVGPHALRIALTIAGLAEGTQFSESDRNFVTYIISGAAWHYKSGMQVVTLTPNTKPSLGANDAGYLIQDEYLNEFRWTGSAWTRATPSRFIAGFETAPGTGWILCNGSGTVVVSKDDATPETISVPPVSGAFVKYGTSYTGAQVSPVAPTASGGTAGSAGSHNHGGATGGQYTGIESQIPIGTLDHYHDLDPSNTGHLHHYTISDYTTANEEDCALVSEFFEDVAVQLCGSQFLFEYDDDTASSGIEGQTEVITQSVALDLDVYDPGHAHSISSDGAHTHTLSGITISTAGEPQKLVLLPYMKR